MLKKQRNDLVIQGSFPERTQEGEIPTVAWPDAACFLGHATRSGYADMQLLRQPHVAASDPALWL